MAGRGVTEAAEDHGAGRPAGGRADPGRTADRERRANGAGRCEAIVDVCGITASALLPIPCGGRRARVLRRRDQAQQDVPNGILPRYWRAPLGEKGPRPVVQQGRVGRAHRTGDEGVGLVACGADRVEALPLAAQHPGRQVEAPGGQLRSEDLQAAGPGQGTARPNWQCRVAWRLRRQRADVIEEAPVNRVVRVIPARIS